VATDSSMCPGVDSASKNEHQDNPGVKSGRCVRLTSYHLHVPIAKKSGSLNLLEPYGPVQACNGTALPFTFTNYYYYYYYYCCIQNARIRSIIWPIYLIFIFFYI